MSFLFTLNHWLAIGGLLLVVVTVVLLYDYIFNASKWYRQFVSAFVWQILAVTIIGSVALSLVYSEYFGFVPCSLCWLQRIALYPQVIMVLMAVKKKEAVFFPLYAIGLSVFGLLVAIYQYIYQALPKESAGGILPCLVDGSSDCATKVINEFGFVTFPLLSAITFTFLIVVYLSLYRNSIIKF